MPRETGMIKCGVCVIGIRLGETRVGGSCCLDVGVVTSDETCGQIETKIVERSSMHACSVAPTQPRVIVNAMNRQWAADLAWNLTNRSSSIGGGGARHDVPQEYMPLTLMRLPHVKREVWGPPSWQYNFQANEPAEHSTMRIIQHLTGVCEDAAQDDATPAPLVVELGANEGAFGRVASASGCRVLSVEPQAACIRMLALAVAMVPSRHSACLVHGFVSNIPFSLTVPSAPCSGAGQAGHTDGTVGTFQTKLQVSQIAAEARARMQPAGGYHTHARAALVPSVAVDSLVDEDVLLIKVDIEGAEIGALLSASRLFATRRVHNLIIEFKPTSWRDAHGSQLSLDEGWNVIKTVLAQQKYNCASLPLHAGRTVEDAVMSTRDIRSQLERYLAGSGGNLDLWCKQNASYVPAA